MSGTLNGNRSRALAKFQKRAPKEHKQLLNLLKQAAESKLEEREVCLGKEKDANYRSEEAGKCEPIGEVARVQRRASKRVTWDNNLLRIRSISPRQTKQKETPSKIVEIQGLRKSDQSGLIKKPIDFSDCDENISRNIAFFCQNGNQEHTVAQSDRITLPVSHEEKSKSHNVLLNVKHFSMENNNIVPRSIIAEPQNSYKCNEKGNRTSLNLKILKPCSSFNDSSNIPTNSKKIFLASFSCSKEERKITFTNVLEEERPSWKAMEENVEKYL